MLICLPIAIIIFALTSDAISAFARLKVPNWLATTLALIAIAFRSAGRQRRWWRRSTRWSRPPSFIRTARKGADPADRFQPRAREGPSTFFGGINVAGWMRSAAGQASNLISGRC